MFVAVLGLSLMGGAEVHFSAENDRVAHPVPIPSDAWAVLRRDEDVRTLMSSEVPALRDAPRSWFSAASVPLRTGAAPDLVIEGVGLMPGANVTTFWIFAHVHGRLQLALKVAAHDLELHDSVHKGYKEIEASSGTATRIATDVYRFDGLRYVLYRRHTRDL